ncbi:unnamed protein product [Caenorhabditis brenneri]
MVLQSVVLPGVLCAEIVFVFVLVLSWFRPILWDKLSSSRLFTVVSKHSRTYSIAFGFVLFILFVHGDFETTKLKNYKNEMHRNAEMDVIYHMHLSRAQEKVFFSGLSLLFFFVILRIIRLLTRNTRLELAGTSAMLQTENAFKTS